MGPPLRLTSHRPRGDNRVVANYVEVTRAPETSSVHTHFMRFPIDVVFLDSEWRIVSVVAALGPWRFAAARSAESVLELAGGECERLGLAEGDVLRELAV